MANARKLKAISASGRKSDRIDAELLARLGHAEPGLLAPIRHRGDVAQAHRAVLGARDLLVGMRTRLVNHVRGVLKSFGDRIAKCDADTFAKRAPERIPDALKPALLPLLAKCAELTAEIKRYDAEIERLSTKEYAEETERLRQVHGVGPITALAFVLTLETPERFARSRDVGAYLGLCPRLHESGDRSPELRITKAGDGFMRRLLVQCAQHILRKSAVPDSALRRWGLALAERGGKNTKKRAIVAVARKLAVLLHRLWISGEPYEPLRGVAVTTPPASAEPATAAKPVAAAKPAAAAKRRTRARKTQVGSATGGA